jgi:parallel beta-helix repeat protein
MRRASAVIAKLAALVFTSQGATSADVDVTAPPFGARCNGQIDDHDALQAALVAGETVLFPGKGRVCVTSRSLRLKDGQTLTTVARGKSVLKLQTSGLPTLLDLTGVHNARIAGLVLDGSAATALPHSNIEAFIVLRNAANNRLDHLVVQNPPGTNGVGAVTLSGSTSNNLIAYSTFVNARGSDITLTGSEVQRNAIRNNSLRDSGFWGVYLGQGASFNVVEANDCSNGDGTATAHGGECYAETVRSNHNVIAHNIARGAGDDGISVSGSYTIVAGNRVSGSYYSGIHIWGSNNTITENWLRNNGQSGLSPIACIGVNGYFGGAGQNNVIEKNHCIDDQGEHTQLGIILAEHNYMPWRAGLAVHAGQYALNGLRIYQASSSGITGSKAPIHNQGNGTDGGVTWAFVNTFVHSPSVLGNIVRYNDIDGYKGNRPYADSSNWSSNTLIER